MVGYIETSNDKRAVSSPESAVPIVCGDGTNHARAGGCSARSAVRGSASAERGEIPHRGFAALKVIDSLCALKPIGAAVGGPTRDH